MKISLSDHFTYGKLIRFTMPSILMMLFSCLYPIVDALFVSNYAGKTAFAAVNLIIPFWAVCCSVGSMFCAGGGAFVSKTLGEGNSKKANESFSLFIFASFVIGILVSIIGYILAPAFSKMMGAEGELFEQSVLYLRIILWMLPFMFLQIEFQGFCATAEKPKLGFYFALAAGFINVIFNALLIGYFKLGIIGAAAATNIGILVGGGVPFLYFASKNSSLLRICKCTLDLKALFRAMTNGVSQLLSGCSGAVVIFLYNYQLMRYLGEGGVVAFGVALNAYAFFNSFFRGYAYGSSPLFGYNFGARNAKELKNLLSKSLKMIFFWSFLMFSISEIFAGEISDFFVGYDEELFSLTKYAMEICMFSVLLLGFNIFSSAFFTALSDGVTAAKISLLGSFIIESSLIISIPIIFGKDSLLWASSLGEVGCSLIAIYFFIKKRNLYLDPKPNY